MSAAEAGAMPTEHHTEHHTEHRRVIAAPADRVYDLIADVTRWPVIFAPTVHVSVLEHDAAFERFEIWALVNGTVVSWRSRRTFDKSTLTIDFEQEQSAAPLASMAGEWTMVPTVGGGTEVVLTHRFSVVDDLPAAVDAMVLALDQNSDRELAALAAVAEMGYHVDELVFDFDDTVSLVGAAADACEFIARGDRWSDLLPHVARADLEELPGGVQWLAMDTVTPDGSEHTTRSVRLSSPDNIVFKQTIVPDVMLGHAGEWRFRQDDDGASVTIRHQVALDPSAISGLLGPGASVEDARLWATTALRKNSRTTIGYANAFAAGRVPAGRP